MKAEPTSDSLKPDSGDGRPRQAIRVAVVDDCELVAAGVTGMLAAFPGQVELVDLNGRPLPRMTVDLVLYDPFARPEPALAIQSLCGSTASKVVIYSWSTQPELIQQALEVGAAGYLSKTADAETLVEQLARIHAGDTVTATSEGCGGSERWPGDQHGLSRRESEILSLICRGLSNDEICDLAHLSINTVKTYVRTLYRKIDAGSRTQALLWGIEHGFRTCDAPLRPAAAGSHDGALATNPTGPDHYAERGRK